MKTTQIVQLDETDIEHANIMALYEMTENEAKVLVCVKTQENIITKQIEQCVDMSQPVVSVAVKGLMNKGYIKAEKEVREKDDGKGRPSMVYSLNKSIDEIILDIEQKAMQQIDTIKESIKRLKELA